MNTEDYSHAHNFVWFLGVCEDINDPLEMGRIRVRCFGFHTPDTEKLPTKSLPWANVMMPITSASMTGVGQSATGILQGSWVVGFFKDGTSAQDPLILGTIPSTQNKKDKNAQIGFKDPKNLFPLENFLNEPDIPRESRTVPDNDTNYKESYSYKEKEKLKNLYSSITTGNSTHTWSCTDVASVIKPAYPDNHTTAFKDNSNVVEFDSTASAQRYSHIGPNKTFIEIENDGSKTEIITGDSYRIIAKGENVYIQGGCNLTIEEGCRTKITGDWNIEVIGDKIETITGQLKQTVNGDVTEIYKGATGQTTTTPTGKIFLN